MKNENLFINVLEATKLLNRSTSYCYQLLKKMNKELEMRGILTSRGRVPKKYFMERMKLL